MKTWNGNPEPTGDWRVCSDRFECDGAEWVILYKTNEKGFLNLKVAADGRAPNKANYWFSFKIADGYFFGRDLTIMRSNRSELYEFVNAKVKEIVAQLNSVAA
jgi:hypothetical protein